MPLAGGIARTGLETTHTHLLYIKTPLVATGNHLARKMLNRLRNGFDSVEYNNAL
jgi:hypothetical protein